MKVRNFHALKSGRVEGLAYGLTVVDLGVLQEPSGRLEACDPFVFLGGGAVLEITPGAYPVRLTIADVSTAQDGSHLREAYLSLVVAEGEVARVALPAGEPAVPVDAGTVAFVDAEAVERCMPEGDWYEDLFENDDPACWFAQMDSPEHLREGCANIVLPLATRGKI